MTRAMPSAERPSYEQLEEIIRRKDNLVTGLFWDTAGLSAAAWLAHHAHDSGHPGYSEDEYAGAASHLFRLLATQARAAHESFSDAHQAVRKAVLAGAPETGEAHNA